MQKRNEIFCPCVDCENKLAWEDSTVIRSHLINRGFKKNYTIWTKHGEIDPAGIDQDDYGGDDHQDDHDSDDEDDEAGDDEDDEFDVEELLRHMEPQMIASTGAWKGLDTIEILEKASKELLYDESKGCDKEFTQFRAVLELLKLKASHGWSDSSFTELLSLLAKILSKPNT